MTSFLIGLTGLRPGLATSRVGRLSGMLGRTPAGSLVTSRSDDCLALTATRLGLEAPGGNLGLNTAPTIGGLVMPDGEILAAIIGWLTVGIPWVVGVA